MKSKKALLYKNITVFSASYPASLLAAFIVLITTIKFSCITTNVDRCIVSGPAFEFAFLWSIGFCVVFILMLIPCTIAFSVVKLARWTSFKAYFYATTLVAATTSTAVAFWMAPGGIAFADYYDDWIRSTLELMAIIAPATMTGTIVFRQVEQKLADDDEGILIQPILTDPNPHPQSSHPGIRQ